ncbi:glycoside hydrolase family 97 protein [Zobellia barbeyronii]|uniref:Glycoside hydrolase family 97 catalytic domain-containing protein n=1 Tax=Zobellia barbeyronii TaxID=2748009 RepID=A0ABS5WDQ7_9FLAO|nr:glycoside hydrolase family 97 protein [Zobellia barbeyronii]MBT2161538.1 glycoside hydrolase family 97 catalytic domain-containing protein [Zobellia barbeyronii]
MIKILHFLKYKILVLIILVIFLGCSSSEKTELKSPDGTKKISVTTENDQIEFTVFYNGNSVLLPSTLEIISEQLPFSGSLSVLSTEHTSESNTWHSNFLDNSSFHDNYNQLKVLLDKGGNQISLIVRAYNEGIALAYEILEQGGITEIDLDEKINYNFKEDYKLWSTPKREKGVLTAQGEYRKIPISQLQKGCERPLVIEMGDSLMVALAEAKLVDFARLSFDKGSSSEFSIVSSLDSKMGEQQQDTITGAVISEQHENMMKVHKKLPFQSPWRVVMMAENEGQLLTNNSIIQNLNDASEINDESWIKPGKVIREATLTTEGGYVTVDFAANHNMQYVLFDAGWYGNEMYDSSDATTITVDPNRSKGPLDLKAVIDYGKTKNIGVILYVNRRALEKQLDEVLELFQSWGVAGIKFGFVRVGDQDATAWLHEAIKKAASYKMVVDVHDEYRPTGFSRTYPNFLTQEGIAGDETTVTNEHTLITMFTRMLAGAADNTVCYYNSRVDVMGSHASQLAKTVCIFSPLQFLYWYDKPLDSPEKNDGLWGDTRHIGNEPELEFFDAVPTTWDETKVLEAQIGGIGVIARRKGNDWFVGGINGNQGRTVELDFSFLDENTPYKAKLYTDDRMVQTRTHVKIEEKELDSNSLIKLNIERNSGFAMRIQKTN